MLEIKQCCENCGKKLPNDSSEAMICSFECTFCKACVESILQNVCPNCGGGFELRPTRPHKLLDKNSPSKAIVFTPVENNKYLETNKNINPRER
jgi:hypothetical protein